MRAVLHANVLVSATLSACSAPAELVRLVFDGELELVVTERLLTETERTLRSPKLAARMEPHVATAFVAVLREVGLVVQDSAEAPGLRSADPDDDYLIALAARERVPLVTGDGHLLELRDRAPIFTPREFLDRITAARPRPGR